MTNNKSRYILKGLVIGFMLVTNFLVSGQYLNEVHETDSVYEYAYNFNFEGAALVGIHSFQDSNWTQNGSSGIVFKSYDNSYQTVIHQVIDDPNFIYLSGKDLLYDGTNYYHLGSKRKVAAPDTLHAYLMKFDPTGNLLWEKNYFVDSKTASLVYGFFKNDSLYIAGSNTEPITDNHRAFIISLDTSGNMGWTKYYLGDNQFATNFHSKSGNGFIYTTVRQLGLNIPTSVYKLDSIGEIEWETVIGYPSNGHFASADTLPNGSVLCYGYSEDQITSRARSWLVELSSSGAVLKDTIFDFSTGFDAFQGYSKPLLFNNEFQLIGGIYDDETSSTLKLHITRYDYNFNLLWRRVYYQRNTDNETIFQHNLGNGFTLFAGNVAQDNVSNTRDEWFLELDSLGCDTPNCALGLEELKNNEFLIYPNPAVTTISVDFKTFNNDNLKVDIVNLAGELVESYQLVSNLNSMNIQHLTPGAYFVVIKDENSILQQEKLVIN